MVYSYDDRNSDHRLIRADACGDVALHTLNNDKSGFWSVTNSKGHPNR